MTTSPDSLALTEEEIAVATVGVEFADETLAAAAATEQRMVGLYDPQPGMSFADYRKQIFFGSPESVDAAEDLTLGSVPIRRFTPSGPVRGHYLHLHGGGWCLGSHDSQDTRLQSLSDATGLVVSSVGYRLAPEHPFPACADDALAAAIAILHEPGFHAIGGESAGAHLSALTMIALRDRGSAQFDAAVLTFGAYDLTLSRLDKPLAMLLPGADLDARRSPTVSPLFADLTGLPPARFTVGTRDQLMAQTLALHEAWPTHRDNELDVFAGAAHAFTSTPIRVTAIAREREHAFLARMSTPDS